MSSDFSIKVKFWIEKKGVSILGPGRIAILESIEKTGSLTEATKACNISFRKGWKLINEINEQLEQPVIISERGGTGGGGRTSLTEYGKKLVLQYRIIQTLLDDTVKDSSIFKI
ncbi:MAG: LysR family transcriptional regulator [Candidatus Heimdallarchaeota archaeon]|nr:LysR family transcriptional regulator [Candidatus Heimdallarchaeota archaeon]